MSQLVTELVSGGNVKALRIVDDGLVTLAYSAVPGLSAEQAFDAVDRAALQAILRGGRPTSALNDEALTVIAPVTDSAGRIIGAVLVSLPIGHVQSAIGRAILAALGAAGVVLAAGLAASVFLARRVTGPVEQLAAAAARIESGQYARLGLESVCARRDEIGHLARLFERMAGQVYAREQQLSRQVAELRIEIDEARRARQVEEITESEFFKDLRARADQLRQRGRPAPDGAQ
jgi:sigma-B regulation protein RsbU (phosphoserine phosphatase)